MPRIKFYTRSFDLRLYRLSSGLFRGLKDDEGRTIPCVRLTDKSADGYFYAMLRDRDCDIAVNIDEDAFLTDPQALRDLLHLLTSRRVAEAGESVPLVNIGYSDGDEATTSRDPVITNPFFNVLDLRAIRSSFDRQAMIRLPQDREPYYPFFRWTAANFQTLYLPCSRHADGMTTIGYDGKGRTVCLHTWFSRFYSMPTWLVKKFEPAQGMQKQRIDAIIREAYAMRGMEVPQFGLFDNIIFALDKTLRWLIKIPQRIANLPAKWAARRKGFSRNG